MKGDKAPEGTNDCVRLPPIAPSIGCRCSASAAAASKILDEFAVAPTARCDPPIFRDPAGRRHRHHPRRFPDPGIEPCWAGPPRSSTETSVLERAGRDRASLGVRSTAGDPDTRVVDKGQSTQTILAAPQADSPEASAQTPQQ